MPRWMLFVMVLLVAVTPAVAQQTPAQQRVTPQPGEIPQIVAFDKEGLLGDHIHIFGNTAELGKWNNSIASMVILGGHWEFFDEKDFKGARMGELGPGIYLRTKDQGLKEKSISSIRLVSPPGR
jgi:Beta/Gamma crystallin